MHVRNQSRAVKSGCGTGRHRQSLEGESGARARKMKIKGDDRF